MGKSAEQLEARFDARQLGSFVLKALLALCAIYLVAHAAPALPPVAVGMLWAAMSAVVAVGIAYPYIIRKLLNRYEYEPGGRLARINDGRIVRLTVSFVVAAVLVAGLLLEAAKWEALEWGIAALAIPVFLAWYALLGKAVAGEFRERFRVARRIQFTRIAATVLLCVVYMAALALAPSESYANAAEAFLASANPFQNSSSALLCEGGKLASLVDGLYAYLVSRATEGAPSVYVFWKTLLSASAFYSINAAMGLCALRAADVRQVFAPLEQVESAVTGSARGAAETHPDVAAGVASTAQSGAPLVPRFVAVMVALPVLLAALFTVADAKAHDIVSTQEYTAIDQIIRNQAGLAVCVIDGKSYDYGAVQDFLKRLNANSASLGEEARNELTPLINEVFDKRVENVDKYLDWYYSLKADYESLMHFVDNTVEDYARQQLDSAINDGVDDTLLNERFAYYAERAAELERAAKQELAAYEVDVPDWLITTREQLDQADALTVSFDASERLQEAMAKSIHGARCSVQREHENADGEIQHTRNQG